MKLITAWPRGKEGHLLKFPALDVEGSYQYGSFPYVTSYNTGTEIIFFPENTDAAYITAANELLGEELRMLLMQSHLFDTSKPGTGGVGVPDEMVDNFLRRLNQELADKPVCEFCFRVLIVEGTRTCRTHRDELTDNTARNLDQFADTPIGDIVDRIIARIWPPDSRNEVLFSHEGYFYQIMRVQEVIGEFLSQNRWPQVIDEIEITSGERADILRMLRSSESMIREYNTQGRLKQAQEAYIRMILLILRRLGHWPSFPIYL